MKHKCHICEKPTHGILTFHEDDKMKFAVCFDCIAKAIRHMVRLGEEHERKDDGSI